MFLIKNVISLTNCFIAFAAGLIVFMVLYLCDSLREQKAGEAGLGFFSLCPVSAKLGLLTFGVQFHVFTPVPSWAAHVRQSMGHECVGLSHFCSWGPSQGL